MNLFEAGVLISQGIKHFEENSSRLIKGRGEAHSRLLTRRLHGHYKPTSGSVGLLEEILKILNAQKALGVSCPKVTSPCIR